jgi:hypothetical protein
VNVGLSEAADGWEDLMATVGFEDELWEWTGERDAAGCLVYELRERPEPGQEDRASFGNPDSRQAARTATDGAAGPEVIQALRAARALDQTRRRREATETGRLG